VPAYALLLRGINLVRHNRIAMAELRRVLEGAGLAGVQTYIQSGNVLVDSAPEDLAEAGPPAAAARADLIGARAEQALARHGLKNVSVTALAWDRLQELAEGAPWPEFDPGAERAIGIFLREPTPRGAQLVGEHGPLRVVHAEPEVLLGLVRRGDPRGYDVTKVVEKRLGTPATVRFWSVVEDWVRTCS